MKKEDAYLYCPTCAGTREDTPVRVRACARTRNFRARMYAHAYTRTYATRVLPRDTRFSHPHREKRDT